MLRSLVSGVLVVCLVSGAWAGSFDNAVNAMPMGSATRDQSGFAARAGVSMSPGPQPPTLFQARANIGGSCGAFNFATSVKEAFEEIPQLLEDLAWGVIKQLPMLALCYAEPVVCDIAKHIQSYLNVLIQARYAQCQTAQNAGMYVGLRLRMDAVSECLVEQQKTGVGIERAMRACHQGGLNLRLPDGSMGGEVRVIEDSLRVAGASLETQELARAFLGDVTVRGGDAFSVSSTRPLDALLRAYQTHRQRYVAAHTTAVEEYQLTGRISEPTLRAISLPGQPAPLVAVQALAAMRQEPERYEAHVGSLSTTAALGQLTWECNDLQAQIDTAMEGNPNGSEAQTAQVRKRLERLRENVTQVTSTVLAAEKHSANMDKLLFEYTKLMNAAGQAGLAAPSVQIPQTRYGTQHPLGYAR